MTDAIIAAELKRARAEGVTHPENLPFFLGAAPPSAAALLVHGYSASPREMHRVGQALQACGISSLGVRLPGHGTTPEDLATQRYEDWLETVTASALLLKEHYPVVHGVGMSTGALLLLAASRSFPFNSLSLLSPFLRLQHALAPWVWLLRWIKPYQQRPLLPCNRGFYYDRRPLNGIYQIQRLLRTIRPHLSETRIPALVIGAEGDQTVYPSSTRDLFDRLASPDKTFHQFGQDTPHVLTTDENPHLEETLDMVCQFLLKRTCPSR